MGLIDQVVGHLIGIDSVAVIYYVTDEQRYAPLLNPLFESIEKGDLTGVTSTVTLVETLVHPIKSKNTELIRQIKSMLLESENILTFDLTDEIAEQAASLRATYGIKTPDAIQIATALSAGATTFLTNDIKLRAVRELKVLVLQDFL